MGFKEIAGIISALMNIVQIIFNRTNSPEMVSSALNNFRQDLEDHATKLETQLSQPGLSADDHKKIVEQLRLQQS